MGNRINIRGQTDNALTSSRQQQIEFPTTSSALPSRNLENISAGERPTLRGLQSPIHPGQFVRDENFKQSVKLQANQKLSTNFASQGTIGIVSPVQINPSTDSKKHEAGESYREPSSEMAGFSRGKLDHPLVPAAMTPVTVPSHHTMVSSPQGSSVVTYTPFIGTYQTPISVPGYQGYIPVGSPSSSRMPAVESYSAMLASMGNQLQLAQAQGQVLPGSYLPSGYIALSGQYSHMPPVLIPTSHIHNRDGAIHTDAVGSHLIPGPSTMRQNSQENRIETHCKSQERFHEKRDSETVKKADQVQSIHDTRRHPLHAEDIPSHGIRPHVSAVQEPMFSRSSDSGPPFSTQKSRQVLSSLDVVLGKTTNPQPVASAPGGIKIELPPPTIGMHIGTKPPQLAPLNTAIVPPLIPLPADIDRGAKLLPASSTDPLPSFGLSSRPLSSHSHSLHQTAPHILPSLFESKAVLSPTRRHVPPSSSNVTPHSLSNLASNAPPGHLLQSRQQTPSMHQFQLSEIKKEKDLESTQISWSKDISHSSHDRKVDSRQSGDSKEAGEHSLGETDQPQVQSSRPVLTSQPPPVANVPSYFTRGSIIQLASGLLKRVEELQTEDFINSSQLTDGLKIDSSTVSRIEKDLERGVAHISFLVGEHKAKVTVEARLDHPFFVYGQGWSSVCPSHSQKCYFLNCHELSVGDVCVSLTVIERKDSRTHDYSSESNVREKDIRNLTSSAAARTQTGLQSPERKRQKFHETRMTSFDESVDIPLQVKVKVEPRDHHLKSSSKSEEGSNVHELQGPSHHPARGQEFQKDQNQNLISMASSQEGSLSAPVVSVSASSPPRWSQPPKRRWSDPIKTLEENLDKSKDILPNPPHPSALSKLTEEH